MKNIKTFLTAACVAAYLGAGAQTVVSDPGALVDPAARYTVTRVANVVIDPEALTVPNGQFGDAINGESFQQEALITFDGYQYVAYYDKDRKVCLARRNLSSGKVEIARVPGYTFIGGKKGSDVHNTVSVGLCEVDRSLHLSFDHHNDTLNYVGTLPGVAGQAKVKWNSSIFRPMDDQIAGKTILDVCYPRFLSTPDKGLQLAYRVGHSSNGEGFIADYDPATAKWVKVRQIDSRLGTFKDFKDSSIYRSLYRNGLTYDNMGVLHSTGMWRERSGGTNHDLLYMYSPDFGDTWYNNKNVVIGSTAKNTLVSITSPDLKVADIGRDKSLMNQQAQAVDALNRIHAVIWHKKDGIPMEPGKWWDLPSSAYFHYWRKNNGQWARVELSSPVGSRAKIAFDKDDNLIMVYTVKNAKDPRDKGFHYTRGTLIIATASADKLWRDWKVVYQEEGLSLLGDPLIDNRRMASEGMFSVYVQETPASSGAPSPLRVLEYKVEKKK